MTRASETYNKRIQKELRRADYDRGFNCRMGSCRARIDSVAIEKLTADFLSSGGQIKKLDNKK